MNDLTKQMSALAQKHVEERQLIEKRSAEAMIRVMQDPSWMNMSMDEESQLVTHYVREIINSNPDILKNMEV